jgi:hypothetical protein
MYKVILLIDLRFVILRKLLALTYMYCRKKLFVSKLTSCTIHRIVCQKLFACVSVDILSSCSLSYDRSIASSKADSPQSAS